MPEGAVSLKMQAEGIPQHVQDAVLSPPSSQQGKPIEEEDEFMEEEIVEDEEETFEESIVASSAAGTKNMDPPGSPRRIVSIAPNRTSTPPTEKATVQPQLMSDEDFGEPWVVDKDRVVQYEEIYVDDDGNEVVVPPDASARSDLIDQGVEIMERPIPTMQQQEGQKPNADATREAPEQYLEPANDPMYDVESQKRMLNRGTNAYRSKMSMWVPIIVIAAMAAAALLIVYLAVLPDEDGIEQRSIPTLAPTPLIVIPVEPTNSGVIDVAITTPFDPITTDCDFSNSAQPHVITQCACTGSVRFVADDVKKRYELLSLNFMPTVLPEFGEPMSSCDPINQALLWLSTGSNNAGESEPYVRRERYALAYFFMAQGGIAWAQNTNWISEVDVCQWSGITCDAKGAVLAINMPNNRVIGQVRRFFGLYLYDWPSDCVSISHLTSFLVPTQQLSPFMILLDTLETFNATRNRIEGTVPAEVLSSSTLRFLDLSSNFMFGEIPSVPTESKLEIIDFSGNNLSKGIPSTLGNVKSLTFLDLSRNAFSGGIPSELFSLPLQELYLQGNALSGTIPDGVSGFSALRVLILGPNQFTGDIPSALGAISSLTRLVVEEVPTLGGRLPASFGIGLTNLTDLILTDTAVEGNIPEQFGQMSSLERLVLSRNSLGQVLPTELGLLTNLRKCSYTTLGGVRAKTRPPLSSHHPLLQKF